MSEVAESIPRAKPPRLESIDLLRGLTMAVMALDHSRDYYYMRMFDPEDLTQTFPALFFTRWITHYCAPIFMLLAGVGAYLSLSRGKSKADLSRFLWTRGIWLIVLEFGVINFTFGNFDIAARVGSTLWALGWSMIALAGILHLPARAIWAISGLMIMGHNAFDGLQLSAQSWEGKLWTVLHTGGRLEFGGVFRLMIQYPLIPWIGVMAAGYALGPVFQLPAQERRTWLLRGGLALTFGFFLVRGLNVYGDPVPWTTQNSPFFTAMSFLNVEKYPPSLSYLLMTLGPALLILRSIDGWRADRPVLRQLVVFGQVPMPFYVLHLVFLLLSFIPVAWLTFGPNFMTVLDGDQPPVFPLGLAGAYLAWSILLAALYPICARYAWKKRENPKWWMSYW